MQKFLLFIIIFVCVASTAFAQPVDWRALYGSTAPIESPSLAGLQCGMVATATCAHNNGRSERTDVFIVGFQDEITVVQVITVRIDEKNPLGEIISTWNESLYDGDELTVGHPTKVFHQGGEGFAKVPPNLTLKIDTANEKIIIHFNDE